MRAGVKARSRHEAAVLVVEDLHWIDDASAAFLDTLVEAVAGTRTLLLCTYRPEHDAAWTGDAAAHPARASIPWTAMRPTSCSASCSDATARWTGCTR